MDKKQLYEPHIYKPFTFDHPTLIRQKMLVCQKLLLFKPPSYCEYKRNSTRLKIFTPVRYQQLFTLVSLRET